MIHKIFYCALCLLLATSCTYDKKDITPPDQDVCDVTPATFSNDVHVIFQTNCAIGGCHNAASASGGVVLETYNQVVFKIDRINQRALIEQTMPPTGPLSAKDINTIKCWINSGMPDN